MTGLFGRVLLIDAYAQIFRAYHAYPDLRTSTGIPTAAVHGFFSILLRMNRAASEALGGAPRLAVVFDEGAPQARLDMSPDYKANRPETPADLKAQVPYIRRILEQMGLPPSAVPGEEADDVIAAVALREASAGADVLIASPDKDFFQILSDRIRLLRPGRPGNDFDIFDPAALKKRTGLTAERMVDYFAMVGDKVDNVPGIHGVGEKTASRLLEKYKSLDNIYAHLEKLPRALREKFVASRDAALLAREMVRLRTSIPADVPLNELDVSRYDQPGLRRTMAELEISRLARQLGVEFEPAGA